jgi:hypothetical protein
VGGVLVGLPPQERAGRRDPDDPMVVAGERAVLGGYWWSSGLALDLPDQHPGRVLGHFSGSSSEGSSPHQGGWTSQSCCGLGFAALLCRLAEMRRPGIDDPRVLTFGGADLRFSLCSRSSGCARPSR